jgi:hypothetical protein
MNPKKFKTLLITQEIYFLFSAIINQMVGSAKQVMRSYWR